MRFGEAVKTDVFGEIVSIAASRHLLYVTVICTKLWDEDILNLAKWQENSKEVDASMVH